MSIEGRLQFQQGTYRAQAKIADGVQTAIIDIADVTNNDDHNNL